MTACLIIGDVHLSDRAPSSRTGAYAQQVLAKIRWCVTEANRRDVPLVFAGDVFHIKVPWRTSYGLVQALHTELAKVARGVWIVPGNHDLAGDRLDSLDSQPLGALARMGNVRLLMGHDPDLPGVAGLPYLTEFDGGDWAGAIDRYVEATPDLRVSPESHDGPQLLVSHAPLFPPGQAPGVYASIDPSDWGVKVGELGYAASYLGHIHECHGTYEVPAPLPDGPGNTHLLCNQGALSRGSIHESAVNRRPAVTLWDPQAAEPFTRLELPYGPGGVVLPAEEVYLFAEAEQKAERRTAAAEFADALGSVALDVLTVEAVVADIRRQGARPEVLAIIDSCLEETA